MLTLGLRHFAMTKRLRGWTYLTLTPVQWHCNLHNGQSARVQASVVPTAPNHSFPHKRSHPVQFPDLTAAVNRQHYQCSYCGRIELPENEPPKDRTVKLKCDCGGNRNDGVRRAHQKWFEMPLGTTQAVCCLCHWHAMPLLVPYLLSCCESLLYLTPYRAVTLLVSTAWLLIVWVCTRPGHRLERGGRTQCIMLNAEAEDATNATRSDCSELLETHKQILSNCRILYLELRECFEMTA